MARGPLLRVLCALTGIWWPDGHHCVTAHRATVSSSWGIFSLPAVYFCPFKWSVVTHAARKTPQTSSASILLLFIKRVNCLTKPSFKVHARVKLDWLPPPPYGTVNAQRCWRGGGRFFLWTPSLTRVMPSYHFKGPFIPAHVKDEDKYN